MIILIITGIFTGCNIGNDYSFNYDGRSEKETDALVKNLNSNIQKYKADNNISEDESNEADMEGKADDILAQYADYKIADDKFNKAGITVNNVEDNNDYIRIKMYATNPIINESENNAGIMTSRLDVVNAEAPDIRIDYDIELAATTTNWMHDNRSTTQYYSYIHIPPTEETKIILIYFSGISETESPEVAAEPIFFIVDLGRKKLLTEKPLLAGDLFGGTEHVSE